MNLLSVAILTAVGIAALSAILSLARGKGGCRDCEGCNRCGCCAEGNMEKTGKRESGPVK